MEKINIAELLKDCPKGMELDCTMYDNLYFDSLNADYYGTINCYTLNDGIKTSIDFTKYGTFNNHTGAKCVIFPKGKTTWEGFIPPCPFKDGDVLHIVTGEGDYSLCIVDCIIGNVLYTKASCSYNGHFLCTCEEQVNMDELVVARLATDEGKQILFDAINKDGYKWNVETKTLEKLIEPKFKVGDRIRHKKKTKWTCVIRRIDDRYWVDEHPMCYTLPFGKQDEYELVPNKFDVNTLKPFDKVLVRCSTLKKWRIQFFEKYDKTYPYPFICLGGINYKQCIPYKCNEHLLDTANDCQEFYKNWE